MTDKQIGLALNGPVSNERVWSPFQHAVFADFEDNQGHTVVEAVAGSGKTTTMAEGLRFPPKHARKGMLAFNKSIVEENAHKIPRDVDCRTTHSLALMACRRAYGRIEVEQDKAKRIANEILTDCRIFKKNHRTGEDEPFGASRVARLVGFAKNTLVDERDYVALANLAIDLGLDDDPLLTAEKLASIGGEAMERAAEDKSSVDYDDMVWFPARHKLRPQTFDVLVVDETQDLNAAQLYLVQALLRKGGRIIAVGDRHQCHPPGVKVLTDSGQVAVEDLDPARHKIRPWNRNAQKVAGARSFQKAVRPYDGPMISVEAGGRTVQATPNHRFLARFTDRTSTTTCVYLMYRTDLGFRVGWCKVFNQTASHNGFHLGHRSNIEKAERTWILKTFESRTDASVYESQIAIRYGLPTSTFEPVNGAAHQTSEAIARIFSTVPSDELFSRGNRCLEDHGREFDLPLYPWKSGGPQGRRTYFEVFASNLIPEMMSIPLPDARNSWTEISSILSEHYVGPVFSLEVEKDHSYVANELVTLNSIYQFRGADADAMPRMIAELNAKVLPLSISYRCARSIASLAQQYVPHFQAAPGAPEGVVDHIAAEHMIDLARPGDFIISRTKAPLMGVCLRLLAKGVPACIKGRDIGKSLIEILEKTRCDAVPAACRKLIEYRNGEVERLKALDREEQAGDVTDRVEAILALCEGMRSVHEVVRRIESLFRDDDPMARVLLTTVHKAKGLERDRAWIYQPSFRPWRSQEEANLFYVAITRAKTHLGLVGELGGEKR